MIKKLRGITKVFNSVCEIKKEVCDACDCEISSESFGYVEPGHGYKGRQHWLTTDEDVEDMYHIYEGKKEILLWSTQADHQRKRAHSPDVEESEKRSRYDKYLDKMTEVETIEQELKETHAEGTYSDLQLRSWAHLIQMGQHSSYATPPNKRFYKTIKKANSATDSDAMTSATANSASTLSVSPGKRVNLRGQCVQQLLQLHQLLERGGISKQQYDDMQSTIMGDVRKFD